MLVVGTNDIKDDELFIVAKELIATRSKYVRYSPSEDIFKLRECVCLYTNEAEVVGMLSSGLSEATSISALKLLKYPIVYCIVMAMLKEIDKIAFGFDNDYSCSISKSAIKEILKILFESCADKISDSLERFGNEVESLYDRMVDGHLSPLSKKQYHAYSKIQFSVMGLSIATYTIVIGWMYMRFLKEKIEKYKGTNVNLNDNIADSFIEEFKSNKILIKRVCNYACEMIRIPLYDSNYFDGKTFDTEKFIQHLVTSVNEDLRFDLERDEHFKIACKAFVLPSFYSPMITEEIASFTTYLLVYGKTVSDVILSCFSNANQFNVFKGNWETMIHKGLKNITVEDSLDNIKSRYCMYLTGQLAIPEYIQTDYGEYSLNLLYPCVQGAEALVRTLHTVFDFNQAEPKKLNASELFLFWSFMFAEIYKSYGNRIVGEDTKTILPFVIYALLRLLAPIGHPATDCFYNTSNIHKVYADCKKSIPDLDDVLDYLPECFGIMKVNKGSDEMWIQCVNVVMTMWMGNALNDLLSRNYSIEYIVPVLTKTELSEIILSYINPIYRKMIGLL